MDCSSILRSSGPCSVPYFQKEPDVNGQIGQSIFIDSLLKQKKNGFFIEFGADNGEDLSNSLFFEMKRYDHIS